MKTARNLILALATIGLAFALSIYVSRWLGWSN